MPSMNAFLVAIFSSLIVITEQLSNIHFIEKFIYFLFRFIQIVLRTIHVVDMDIVEMILMVTGLANVNSGGMEHYVINKHLVVYK
jgi:hypothetical protein